MSVLELLLPCRIHSIGERISACERCNQYMIYAVLIGIQIGYIQCTHHINDAHRHILCTQKHLHIFHDFILPNGHSGTCNEPPLPRRKKCPELAYKTHEFINCDQPAAGMPTANFRNAVNAATRARVRTFYSFVVDFVHTFYTETSKMR